MKGYVRWRAGAWRLTVDAGRDPTTGKRKQLTRTVRAPNTAKGRRQAETALAAFVTEAETGRTVATSGLLVAELVERYIADRAATWAEGADAKYRAIARKYIAPHLGTKTAAKLRPADVKHWHGQLRATGLAEASVGRVHTILQSALQWGVDLELLDRNVAARRKPRAAKSKRKAPPDDVMVRLLAAADGDMACYLRLAAVTGARRGTLMALRWSDIDHEDITSARVTFTRALAVVPGGTVEKETKADVDYQVTLDARTTGTLRAHRTRARERALAAGVPLRPDGFVFSRATTPDGRLPWHPASLSRRFDRIRSKVKGAEAVTPHEFRHWMATAMFEDGYDPIAVAGRGGWASPALPLSTYGHRRPARDEAAAQSLADRLDRPG